MVPQQPRRRRRRAVIPRAAERRVIVGRGAGGFGFTIAGQRPCVVSAVAAGGPAERAGLRAGDALIAVDGANVARAPHASVARLVAAAPGPIALSVALREPPPTDTEDTEPDERSRTRRRNPPARRRPQPLLHHPGCNPAPSMSGVNEILQKLGRAHFVPDDVSRLECRAVVGYLGTIETPGSARLLAATGGGACVRSAVRRLRQERRAAAPVLLRALPAALELRPRAAAAPLARYPRRRLAYAAVGADADRRYFGLVTSADHDADHSHSCHVFAVDPRMADHDAHAARAREFQIACTRDPVAERCLEFPPSAEYVVGVVRGMYSLPADDATPQLAPLSKLAARGASPAAGEFARRPPRRRRDAPPDGPEFVANSPQPSTHSEITTTSSNSDSGIGFHNDCRNVADRILVVEFAGQPPLNVYRREAPRRPAGLAGAGFDADGSFLSNTTPVVDGFGGQGRPLNLEDGILTATDGPVMRRGGARDEDNYNYNNIYSNVASTSRYRAPYELPFAEGERRYALEPDAAGAFHSVEIFEERSRQDYQSTESVENVTVISGGTSKASADSVSMYSSRSHEEARPVRSRHLQASLDDMLVLGLRDPPPPASNDDYHFLHPASLKCKVRKSIKPLNLLSKTKHMLKKSEKEKKTEARRRALSASADDVCAGGGADDSLAAAASEPDLRDSQSDQSSPFRRWTTGSGAGSSYRTDHRSVYNKQMSEGCGGPSGSSGAPGGSRSPKPTEWPPVAGWALGLESLLADPIGVAAFAIFLSKEFAGENIRFWYSCEQYQHTDDTETRIGMAEEIFQRHLAERAPEPVNVDAQAKRAAELNLRQSPLRKDLFLQAQKQIFNVMKFDSYPRFLRSETYGECARAQLCGQKPPFLATALTKYSETFPAPLLKKLQSAAITDPVHPDPSTSASSSKVKKSSSNASEKRRSGVNLMRWRTGSKDRATGSSSEPIEKDVSRNGLERLIARLRSHSCSHSGSKDRESTRFLKPAAVTPRIIVYPERERLLFKWRARDQLPEAETSSSTSETKDVVKASQAAAGQGTLCRLVLPDGATSVVEVDAALTVGRLVDRLLEKRKLKCNAYEVLLKEPRQVLERKEGHVQPCTLCWDEINREVTDLGTDRSGDGTNRERIDLIQSAMLRFRKQGEARFVDSSAASSNLGGREVLVERRCLVRLEVRGKCVLVRCRPARRLRHVLRPVLAKYTPDAADAVVWMDGELVSFDTLMEELDGCKMLIAEQRGGTLGARARRREPDADSLSDLALRLAEAALTDGDQPSASRLRPPGAGSSEPAGLVRAALHPGPPLHHPPDFLENLRETQRQMLQNSSEPSPTPRTPPPLPPKPARMPTVV